MDNKNLREFFDIAAHDFNLTYAKNPSSWSNI